MATVSVRYIVNDVDAGSDLLLDDVRHSGLEAWQ